MVNYNIFTIKTSLFAGNAEMMKTNCAVLICLPFFIPTITFAQKILRGHVYSAIDYKPIKNVVVFTSTGKASFTNVNGSYAIGISSSDTIWFKFDNETSRYYLVRHLDISQPLDIFLQESSSPNAKNAHKEADSSYFNNRDSANSLDPVTVYQHNYHDDSLRRRKEYEKYFKYEKLALRKTDFKVQLPFGTHDTIRKLEKNEVPTLFKVTMRIDPLFSSLQKKKQKKLQKMQHDLLMEEQEGYVDERFKKTTIVKYIGSQPDSILSDYIRKARLSYEMLVNMSELEFGAYVKSSFKAYGLKYLH